MRKRTTAIAITTTTVALIAAFGIAWKAEQILCPAPAQAAAATPTDSTFQAPAQPLVCTITDKQASDRRKELLPLIQQAVTKTEELENGYIISIEKEYTKEFLEYIQLERQCCSFFLFTLNFPPGDGPVTLTITGPEGSKAFSSKLFKTASTKPAASTIASTSSKPTGKVSGSKTPRNEHGENDKFQKIPPPLGEGTKGPHQPKTNT